MATKKQKPLKLWCGQIPEIYGYGIMVLERTEEEARKTLKREFYRFKKVFNGERGFQASMDWWGGRIFEVETGKGYNDDFNE
jgi:hypothetical protein